MLLLLVLTVFMWGTLLLWRQRSPRTVDWLPLRFMHACFMVAAGLCAYGYAGTRMDVRGRFVGNPMNTGLAWSSLHTALILTPGISLVVALGVTLALWLQRAW